MKNLKTALFLTVVIFLLLPLQSHAQEIAEPTIGLLQKIGLWIKTNMTEMTIVFIGGIMAKSGWTLILKKIANKGKVVAKELGELFSDGAILLDKVDCAIKDDGTIVQNSIADVITAGKEVIAEGKDVIISIRPK